MFRERLTLDDAARASLGGTYVRLDDGVTHYEVRGPDEGTPLVLLHGGTVPSWCFDELVDRLVAEGRRVVRYDQYGRGWSDRPDLTYDQDLYQRQLDQLLAHLGMDVVDLLGFSWGGAVAIHQAHRHPDRVRKLILVAPVVHYEDRPVQMAIARLGPIGDLFMALVGIRTVVSRAGVLLRGHPAEERWAAAFDAQTRYRGFQRSLKSMVLNGLREDCTPVYEAVGRARGEALLLWGSEDPEIPKEHMDRIRAAFPGLVYVELPGVAHGVFSQASDRVAQEVLAYTA